MDSIITRNQITALDNLKIKAINTMQERAIVHCRSGKSMILLSPTGTGKTLAYLLPLLERISTPNIAFRRWLSLNSFENAKRCDVL